LNQIEELLESCWSADSWTEIPYCQRWFKIKSLDHLNSTNIGALRKGNMNRTVMRSLSPASLPWMLALSTTDTQSTHTELCLSQSFLKLISWGHIIKFLPILTTLRRPQLPCLLVFFNFHACPLVWETAQTFQRFLDEILQDWDFCFAYLVVVLVISRSPYPLHQTSNRRYPTEPTQVRFPCSWNIITGI